MTIADVNSRAMATSLYSQTCPMCGGPKKAGMSLCFREFKRLPREFQTALYQKFGKGYEGALAAAFEKSARTEFHTPPAGGRRSK